MYVSKLNGFDESSELTNPVHKLPCLILVGTNSITALYSAMCAEGEVRNGASKLPCLPSSRPNKNGVSDEVLLSPALAQAGVNIYVIY